MLKDLLVPIHRAGWPFIGSFAAVAVALFFVAQPLGWAGVVLSLWCVYFFRDPARVTPTRDGLVMSPADGVVQLVDRAAPPPELEMGDAERTRICVFMNVFNVHVNRAPCDGTITKTVYCPGKFFNASLDKASQFNERQSIRQNVRLADGSQGEMAYVQIAGLVARRIKCDLRESQEVKAGQRIGLIRFGSRVDSYLPSGVDSLVIEGQQCIAGETVIADLMTPEPRRKGVTR